jgi:hypothetical protein
LIAVWWGLRGRLKRQSGYAVNVEEALRRLETTAPDAAAWWRENVPRLMVRNRTFLFDKSAACEVLKQTPTSL